MKKIRIFKKAKGGSVDFEACMTLLSSKNAKWVWARRETVRTAVASKK